MIAITLNEANYEREMREIKNSALPVLVGFGGENIDSVSVRMRGAYKCYRADSDLAKRYQVRKLPTLLLFKDGKVTDTIVGSLKEEQLLKILG